MEYITTTQLRTKSSQLVASLQKGMTISLIHRSKVVGTIQPKKVQGKPLTREGISTLKRLAEELSLPKTTYAQREKTYRAHMMKKYGKGLS